MVMSPGVRSVRLALHPARQFNQRFPSYRRASDQQGGVYRVTPQFVLPPFADMTSGLHEGSLVGSTRLPSFLAGNGTDCVLRNGNRAGADVIGGNTLKGTPRTLD